jgi:hypothetical protein
MSLGFIEPASPTNVAREVCFLLLCMEDWRMKWSFFRRSSNPPPPEECPKCGDKFLATVCPTCQIPINLAAEEKEDRRNDYLFPFYN